MKAKTILCSLLIASTGLGPIAFAQPGRQDARDARQDLREAQRDRRQADNRQESREAQRDVRNARQDLREARQERRYYNARTAEFRRGGRLPNELRDRHYVVNDWRGHRLSAPPRGYQWVQVGPDYVLASIAGGIIANLILNQ